MPDRIPQTLQELPPKWAHFCLRIDSFIKDDLHIDLTGKSIILACSGGVDSTALLLVLSYLSRKHGGRVIVAHLDHQLRPESASDSRLVQSLCETLCVQCFVRSEDIAALAQGTGIGVEEAGRHARYALFQDVLEASSGDFIAVGHHLDDLGEDVLMRLMRGTGWPGLSGMAGYDPKRHLVRPFLLTPKATLIEFLSDINVPWHEDTTNCDEQWTRNRVRNNILPLFVEENPNFLNSISRLWKVGSIDQDYWAESTSGVCDFIPNARLDMSHQACRLRLYKAALDTVGTGQTLAVSLFKLDKAWCEKRVGSIFQFPGNKIATISSSGVVFSTKH